MILYKDWGKHLRLGNFWFNYATMFAVAKRTGHDISLPDYFAWQYMKHPPAKDSGIQQDELFHFRSHTPTREEIDWLYEYFTGNADKNININLGSNNQSEKWFQDELEYVKEMLAFSPTAVANICKKYSHILGNGRQTIGIGIRRGDFVGHGVFYQIPLDWYMRALKELFPDWEQYNILFFSDHIEEVKTMFVGKNFYFAEPNGTHTHADNFRHYHKDPMEQFILGTQCDHFIGGNSTFSWWQMWYVRNKGGTVVHSGKNLSAAGEKEFGVNKDYYPESWTHYPI